MKENMTLRCVKRLLKKPSGNIRIDDIVLAENPGKRTDVPKRTRRIVAIVEVYGEEREIVFFRSSPAVICFNDNRTLYR